MLLAWPSILQGTIQPKIKLGCFQRFIDQSTCLMSETCFFSFILELRALQLIQHCRNCMSKLASQNLSHVSEILQNKSKSVVILSTESLHENQPSLIGLYHYLMLAEIPSYMLRKQIVLVLRWSCSCFQLCSILLSTQQCDTFSETTYINMKAFLTYQQHQHWSSTMKLMKQTSATKNVLVD